MIIVTGMPRSGTSLMMRLLFYLDVHICGIMFPKYYDKTNNIYGFWEDSEFYSGNFGSIDEDGDFAVKVNLRKLIQGVTLDPTIHRVIACFRNLSDMTTSQMNKEYNSSSTYERSLAHNQKWYGKFDDYISDVPHLKVNLEQLIANKSAGVNDIKTFVSAGRDVDTAIGIIEG